MGKKCLIRVKYIVAWLVESKLNSKIHDSKNLQMVQAQSELSVKNIFKLS